jgi:hypothetical protein
MSSPLAKGDVNISAAGLNAEHNAQSWVIVLVVLCCGAEVCLAADV